MSWYDGSGSDRRLKIKGIVDLPPPVKPERSRDLPDPELVNEVHAESEKALAEGDDRKLGKIYEDVLDTVHSSASTSHEVAEPTFVDDVRAVCPEIEAALRGELKILSDADRRWGWAFKLDDDGLQIVGRDPRGEGWVCTADKKAVLKALADCQFDARHTAGVLVSRSRREILNTRSTYIEPAGLV